MAGRSPSARRRSAVGDARRVLEDLDPFGPALLAAAAVVSLALLSNRIGGRLRVPAPAIPPRHGPLLLVAAPRWAKTAGRGAKPVRTPPSRLSPHPSSTVSTTAAAITVS